MSFLCNRSKILCANLFCSFLFYAIIALVLVCILIKAKQLNRRLVRWAEAWGILTSLSSHLHFVSCLTQPFVLPLLPLTTPPSSSPNHFPPFSQDSPSLFSKPVPDVRWGCAQRPCSSGIQPYAFHTVMKVPGSFERMSEWERESKRGEREKSPLPKYHYIA